MVQKSRQMFMEILKTMDLGCLVFSLLLAVDLSDGVLYLRQFLKMRFSISNIAIGFLLLMAWHLILNRHKLYVSRTLCTLADDIYDIVMATSASTLALLVFALASDLTLTNPVFLFTFWVSTSSILVISRILIRCLLKCARLMGSNLRNLVIVGVHERAMAFARKVMARPELGYRLIGFVDDEGERTPEFDSSGYQLVASIGRFAEFLRGQVVDEVIICLPIKSHYQQCAAISGICEEHGIIVRFLSDIFDLKLAHSRIHQFEGHPIITLYTGQMVGGGVIVKRVMDVIVSLLLIVALLPLFLLVALLVKATSEGPVLFVQKRLGLNKRHFHLYKFRTMEVGAEKRQAELERLNEVHGAAFKISNDPRVTPLGKWLRRTSIDELPQLFNVLKGEMSLVGPRPLPIRDYQAFDNDWHRRRFSVRPGLTCLWQISGRSNISFDRWMELDMQYIDDWSLQLDLIILVKTIPAVLKGSGAV